jgi:hypothetical protein
VKVVLCRVLRALVSIAGEESTPVREAACGKRAARIEVLLPGPQPRSMMRKGA